MTDAPRVLAVEDNAEICKWLQIIRRRPGGEPRTAASVTAVRNDTAPHGSRIRPSSTRSHS